MKIKAVVTKPSININTASKSAVMSAMVIVFGILVGVIIFIAAPEYTKDSLTRLFLTFTTDFVNKNKPEILSGIVLAHIPYFIAMLIFATSVVGTPAVIFLTAAKSMSLGLIVTYIYSEFSLKGIEYCLLILLPGKFILIFVMILLTQNCYITSKDIKIKTITSSDGVVVFKKFIYRSIFILLMMV